MLMGDQELVVAMLSNPVSYGEPGPVETIETHISRIFLVGQRAFKLKRAVKLPYVDFSTQDLRLAACQKEVALNAETAPGLYVGVRRVTRNGDQLALDGAGELVDAVIEMVRFDPSCLLDRMAIAGKLTPGLMTEVARMIARYHRGVPATHCTSGASNIGAVLDINSAGFATSHVFTTTEVEALTETFRASLARHAPLLDERAVAGRIRRCHGDLHLRNICLLGGEPRLFDCIEFNDQIATIDILYDLAFLLMDLWHRGFAQFANLVMNRYLDDADDEDGFSLLPFFMAVRAAVRAHVTATQVEEGSPDAAGLMAEARSYFELAHTLLTNQPPRLVAIGGLSGSGKTTLAEAIAHALGTPPGARIIESDRIRKALHGVPAETKLPDNAYRPEVSEHVYRQIAWRSDLILSQGGCVVADAVFHQAGHRDDIGRVACDRSVPFAGFWLAAAPSVLWSRVRERRDGPSDATVDILSRQLQRDPGQIHWRVIQTDHDIEEIGLEILKTLEQTRQKGIAKIAEIDL